MQSDILLYRIAHKIIKSEIKYKSDDLCDAGNELGFIIGNIIPKMTDEQIEEFITGLRHGISLTNGTH